MAITEAQRQKYRDLLEQALSPQSPVTEAEVFGWLDEQENGDEIAAEDVDLFLAGQTQSGEPSQG